jgi:hypothetical protein
MLKDLNNANPKKFKNNECDSKLVWNYVRCSVRHPSVCGGQSGTVAGFLRVFRFLLPIIPLISPSS